MQCYDYTITLNKRKNSNLIFENWNGHLFKKNMSPLHLQMLCAKFGWNWPSGSGQERIFANKFRQCFSLFRYYMYLPLVKGMALLETWILFTHALGCFVPCLVEIGSIVLQKMNMWKVNRQTDSRQEAIRKAHLSCSAQVS